jgi:lipopolysaccharide export system protein LptC
MSRIGVSIAALFILALLLYIPSWLQEPAKVPQNADIRALTPSYMAHNLTTTIYDQNGERNHQVFAASMEHYDQLGFVLFQEPQYTIYQNDNEPPWQLTANKGTLYDNNIIQLERAVKIVNLAPEYFVQQITTDRIEVNLETKMMTSESPVTIIGPDFVVNSNGFNANLNTQQYELIDHVQTVYTPAN